MIPLHDDNPTHSFPYLTITLIALCVLVYLWQMMLGPRGGAAVIYSLGVIPAVLLDRVQLNPELVVVPAQATIFTSMFLHGGIMHLAGNMLYLWIFGNNIEDAMGKFRFILFYFVCGAAAVFGQVLQDPSSQIPMVGASGAISGVLGAYLLIYPRARVLVVIPLWFYLELIRLPAGWVLGFWFVLQLVSSILSDNAGGGVAFYAHIGGFITGMMLVPVMKHKNVKLFQSGRSYRRW